MAEDGAGTRKRGLESVLLRWGFFGLDTVGELVVSGDVGDLVMILVQDPGYNIFIFIFVYSV